MAEKAMLERAFGESAVFKTLDVLMDYPTMDYSKEELAEVTGLSQATVQESWEDIEKIDAVEESGRRGKTKLYALKQDSKIVEYLFKLDQILRL